MNDEDTVDALRLPVDMVSRRMLIGVPGDVICHLARLEHYDLIVVGARGESLIAGLLLGSTSHRVLQLASCPVLVVR